MMKPQGKSILPTTDQYIIKETLIHLPLIVCQSTVCRLKLVKASLPKLKYRKEIKFKVRNKLCGGTFEKVFCYRRSNTVDS